MLQLSIVALIGLHLLPSSLFEQARRPLQHVTPPPKLSSLSATECAPCHAEIYAQWRTSRHAQSFSNRIFAASFRREPLRWCVYCHAPLPAQDAALKDARRVQVGRDALVDEGVNCAVCHVRDGAVLAARPPTAAALRAHPVRVNAELAQSQFCGGCHQFNFPRAGNIVSYSHEPMQDTFAEWQRTSRTRSCQACHMPQGGHSFPGGHDVALVRSAVSASVQRRPDGRLHVELVAKDAGHRVPTGDPFRRLRLELFSDEDDETPVSRYAFGRRFRKLPGGDEYAFVLDSDTSIPPPKNGLQSTRAMDLNAANSPSLPRYFRLLFTYAAQSSLPDLRGEDLGLEIARGEVQSSATQH